MSDEQSFEERQLARLQAEIYDSSREYRPGEMCFTIDLDSYSGQSKQVWESTCSSKGEHPQMNQFVWATVYYEAPRQ